MTGNNRRRATVMATLLSGIWLVFLADPVRAAWAERGTGPGQLGLAGTLAFGATYLGQFHITRREWLEDTRSDQPSHRRLVLGLYVAMLVLAVVVTIALREVGSALWVFIAIAGLWTFPLILGVVIGTAIVATLVFSPPLLGWGIQPGAAMGGALGMLAVGSGRATGRFRQEVERLRMEEERLRLSRDLHDILGHSLTVITVKADLARKLVGRDAEQAEAELADIERLARDALTDVRHTIAGIRTLSLPTELARSRSALRAAGIEAEIPSAADEVPTERREVFAWALREAITNVVRHSGAEHCQISLSPSMIRVVDDGQGPSTADAWSSGLRGIRDRASRAGATLVTEPVEPHGFSLTVTFEGG